MLSRWPLKMDLVSASSISRLSCLNIVTLQAGDFERYIAMRCSCLNLTPASPYRRVYLNVALIVRADGLDSFNCFFFSKLDTVLAPCFWQAGSSLSRTIELSEAQSRKRLGSSKNCSGSCVLASSSDSCIAFHCVAQRDPVLRSSYALLELYLAHVS